MADPKIQHYSDHEYLTKKVAPLADSQSFSFESNYAQIVEDQVSSLEYKSIKSEAIYQQKETITKVKSLQPG